MNKDIPKIEYKQNQSLDIEVMNFPELFKKLDSTENHDPFQVHKIEFYLILVITENTYRHFVDFKFYDLTKGSAIFVAKNQVHHFSRDLLNADGFCIIFNSLFLSKHFFFSDSLKFNRLFNYHIEKPIIEQIDMGSDSFIGIANKLYQEYVFTNQFAKSEILRSLLHILLLQAERAKEIQSFSNAKKQWLEIFNAFKNKLELEYTKTRNSRYYSSELLVSYKLLNDIVKKLTNKTVKVFIDDFVTMEIKRYLVSTSLSVKEISYETGFDEPANMVKYFKKNTGTTPLKFRQQI